MGAARGCVGAAKTESLSATLSLAHSIWCGGADDGFAFVLIKSARSVREDI